MYLFRGKKKDRGNRDPIYENHYKKKFILKEDFFSYYAIFILGLRGVRWDLDRRIKVMQDLYRRE